MPYEYDIKKINEELINSLMGARLALTVLKTRGQTVRLSKVKEIFDTAGKKASNNLVEKKLSEIFDEFFPVPVQKKDTFSLSDMEGMIKDEHSGSSLVKFQHHGTKPENKDVA